MAIIHGIAIAIIQFRVGKAHNSAVHWEKRYFQEDIFRNMYLTHCNVNKTVLPAIQYWGSTKQQNSATGYTVLGGHQTTKHCYHQYSTGGGHKTTKQAYRLNSTGGAQNNKTVLPAVQYWGTQNNKTLQPAIQYWGTQNNKTILPPVHPN